MDEMLSDIIKKGKIHSQKEHDIVFEEWKRKFYNGAGREEIIPLQTLLSDYENELEKGSKQ